jgi:lipopolysaccharide transport system permease protein
MYTLNPITGISEAARWAVGADRNPCSLVLSSVLVVIVLLITGLAYFRKTERTFADVI